MKIIINFLIGLLISLVSYAQQMDTILLLDYRENLPLIVRDGRGFGEDYLQIIINKNDTINLDAKVVKRKIKFKHKVYYNNNLKKKSPRNIFDNIQFAGLQIVKPQNEAIELQVKSLFHYSFKTKRTHEIDTIMKISKVSNGKLVLWNLYDFDSGMGSGLNYLYPRYTLHSHNWPTPAQLARRKKVRRQIERAIVYRYNTVTRQIVKS